MRAPLVALAALLLAAGAAAQPRFTVTGRFLYADKAWGWGGWTGEMTDQPVRHADVLVLDADNGRVLGRGATDESGEFAVSCKLDGPRPVVARAQTRNRQRKASGWVAPPLSVVDDRGRVWSTDSAQALATGADLDLGTTTSLPVEAFGGEGSPFNQFDMLVAAWQHVQAAGGAQPHGALRLKWPSWSGSWALGRTAHIGDDDGFDDAVILHEIGHLVHNVWSDSDNPGGMHWFGDSDQDPRLAFAEGWATCFAGTVLAAQGQPALYLDCSGADGVGGIELRMDLETAAPYTAGALGSTDEVAVACALFDVLDDTGLADDDPFSGGLLVAGLPPEAAWWAVLTGPARRKQRLALDGAWDGWAAVFGEAGRFDELRAIFDPRGLRFWNDACEPDNEPEQATLLVAGTGWSSEHTLYFAETLPAECGSGDRDWFAVELAAGQVVRIETRYPAGAADACTQADTHLAVFDPQGRRVAWDEDSGAGRNARVDALTVEAGGTWRFRVDSRNPVGRYGRYEARVVLLPLN